MITTGQWADALEPIAIKGFELGKKELPQDKNILFNVKKSDKLTETYLEIGDIGNMDEFTGTVDYDDMAQGYKMTITAKEYAKGIKIQKKLARTDQINVISSRSQALGRAARRRVLSDTYFGYNNAFNTSITTLDTLQLCSSAHTSHGNQGGASQANYGTTAFSAVAVEAVRIAMAKFKTNTDQDIDADGDMLLLPLDLQEKGYEIISSSGKVDTANNNVNFHKGKYKMMVSRKLTDSNNWFMIDSELLKEMAIWNDVDPLEFGQAEDFDGLVAKYRAYMFYGYGFIDWRFIFGSEVS